MKRSISIAINILLVLVSVAVVLFVADLVLKALKLPSQYRTIMLLSGSKLYTDEAGVRRYEPSKEVEQAALVDGEIAYRYKYLTNNLGFVSKYDQQAGRALDLMIVGDSVSEGQEVGPWLDSVQQELWERYGKTSQNMAIAGNGFIEFERAAAYAKNSLGAHKAMLIFIGGDMLRPGDHMQASADCSTYRTIINPDVVNCFSGNTAWHHYADATLSDADLVRFAESRQRLGVWRLVRAPAIHSAITVAGWVCKTGLRVSVGYWLARRYNYECDVRKAEDDLKMRSVALPTPKPVSDSKLSVPAPAYSSRDMAANSASETKPSASAPAGPPADLIPAYTVSALEKILRLYGTENVLLVAIPGGNNSIRAMQPEAVFNHLLGKQFKSPIQFVDLSESCDMPRVLWAPRVEGGPRKGYGHPTAEGYRKLQSCILSSDRVMKFARK